MICCFPFPSLVTTHERVPEWFACTGAARRPSFELDTQVRFRAGVAAGRGAQTRKMLSSTLGPIA
jgi:hypothetical protein